MVRSIGERRPVRVGVFSLMLMGLALSGCQSQRLRPLVGEQLAVLPIAELPPPNANQTRDYHLGAFDVLEIDVFGVPELAKREIQADANGRVSFPLVGTVEARGMTLDDLSREMERRLRGKYIRDPQVTINLKTAVSQVFTVDGEVVEPGLYPVIGEMTLIRAVARAKGITENARLDQVVVFRTVGTQKMAALYDLGSIRNGIYRDPDIYPGDIVIVGDSPARRRFQDFLKVAPLLTTPLVVLLQRI